MFTFVILFAGFLAVLAIVIFIMMIRLRSIMEFNKMLTMSLLMTVDNYRCEPGSRERIEGDTDHHEKTKTSRTGQSAEAGSALPHRRRVRVSLFSISHDEVSHARRAGRSWRLGNQLARLQGSKSTEIRFMSGFHKMERRPGGLDEPKPPGNRCQRINVCDRRPPCDRGPRGRLPSLRRRARRCRHIRR